MPDLDKLKLAMDSSNLYEEKIVSDRKAGVIRMMVPVTAEGAPDPARPTIFMGEAQIMTQMGALPISFEIPAETLAQAVEGYAAAARQGLEDTLKKLEDLRERASHRIVTPGTEGFQMPPGEGMGGSFKGL